MLSNTTHFRNRLTSLLLPGDQKLNILNQNVYSKLIIYPLKTTRISVNLLKPAFLEPVDMLIRQEVRKIYDLPPDTYLLVHYTGRKYRELSMVIVT